VRLLEDPKFKRAILLSGPRRVGKTTVLKQVAELLLAGGAEPVSVVYISLDHPLLKLASLTDLLRIYREDLFAEGKPTVLLLDEVQYAEDWESNFAVARSSVPQRAATSAALRAEEASASKRPTLAATMRACARSRVLWVSRRGRGPMPRSRATRSRRVSAIGPIFKARPSPREVADQSRLPPST
jgi:hypothetical protein